MYAYIYIKERVNKTMGKKSISNADTTITTTPTTPTEKQKKKRK
jgi:hypothetical protein